ncbi:MAG: methyltransferase type 11 [Erythrobacter sp.]|nr:methyltransferase type 11 [Erythrobacter sp.]
MSNSTEASLQQQVSMKNSDKIKALPPLMPNAALRWDVVSRLLPEALGDVIEIGCGQGAAAVRLALRADRFVALEPDPRSFAVAKSRIGNLGTVHNMSSTDLPDGERFDTLCAFEVLEHIEDDRAALIDWVSRLRSGGRIVLSVPAHPDRFSHADEVAGHFRRYDRTDMTALFEEAGLQNIEIVHYGFPSGYLLEAARNHLARRHLAGEAREMNIAQRTASSGRMFQPGGSASRLMLSALTVPMIWVQRVFPDRGIGMIAMARVPE